jgi:hypothetical protein
MMANRADTASDKIRRLVQSKHYKDVVVTECKSGPTQGYSHDRLDAWVLLRTWRPVTMIGYEIKVSRNDFLRDEKWTNYSPLCNQLYFVCPPKLIDPSELPPEVGLMWASKNYARLYTKKKAPRREIDYPSDLVTYVLMSRVSITKETKHQDAREYWEDWLKQKDEDKWLGKRVSVAIHNLISHYRSRAKTAENRMAAYDDIRRKLEAHGIDPNAPAWKMRNDVGSLIAGDSQLRDGLVSVRSRINSLLTMVDHRRGGGR